VLDEKRPHTCCIIIIVIIIVILIVILILIECTLQESIKKTNTMLQEIMAGCELSQSCQAFILKLLTVDVATRITCEKALHDEWITSPVRLPSDALNLKWSLIYVLPKHPCSPQRLTTPRSQAAARAV
jgi:serine/threonine protein kinase